jgi:hypothetical protein
MRVRGFSTLMKVFSFSQKQLFMPAGFQLAQQKRRSLKTMQTVFKTNCYLQNHLFKHLLIYLSGSNN